MQMYGNLQEFPQKNSDIVWVGNITTPIGPGTPSSKFFLWAGPSSFPHESMKVLQESPSQLYTCPINSEVILHVPMLD